MEAKLAELVSAVDGLQDMHQKAITDIAKERDMVAHKYRKVSNKFAMAEASGQKAAAEVETLMKEVSRQHYKEWALCTHPCLSPSEKGKDSVSDCCVPA